MNPIQNPLFKEPVGTTFKVKRETLGMSIDDAAKSMKFGTHLVQAMENEQWDLLGPAVFAKSYISSYIKLLGLNESIKNDIPALSSGTPVLKVITQTPVQPAGIQSKLILATVTLIGLAALIAFLYNRSPSNDTVITENSIPLSVAEPDRVPVPMTASSVNTAPLQAPAISNELPLPLSETALGTQQLLLRTKQETWFEIRDLNNAVIFSELIPANQNRTQSLEKIGKITIGNAASAELLVNNALQNISQFTKKDGVARFTVDASGNPVAFTPITNGSE